MSDKDLQQEYIDRLCSGLPANHNLRPVLTAGTQPGPRVHYVSGNTVFHYDSPSEALAASRRDASSNRHTACVIEDINQEWIATLGSGLDLDPSFFASHAENPDEGRLWDLVVHVQRTKYGSTASRWKYIDGVIPHVAVRRQQSLTKRRMDYHSYFNSMINTRISYYRVSERFYLFLVDKPVFREPSTIVVSRLSAWVPVSRNRGGLPIPQLYSTPHFSAFESLQIFFSHQWHFDVMCRDSCRQDPVKLGEGAAEVEVVFAYLLSASIWKASQRYLDSEIKRISFQDLRRPTVAINDHLHDLRQDLDTLRKELTVAKDWTPPEIADRKSWSITPKTILEEVLESSKALESFLMDTFQLLMNTISVLDSQASILDARRGARLTQLATIYVPLSFVTGIWGMNVKEINGSPLSVWTAVVGLVVVGALTALALWAMSVLPDPTVPVTHKRQGRSKPLFWKTSKPVEAEP